MTAVCWGIPVLVILTTSAAAGAEAAYHEKLLSSSVSFITNLKVRGSRLITPMTR